MLLCIAGIFPLNPAPFFESFEETPLQWVKHSLEKTVLLPTDGGALSSSTPGSFPEENIPDGASVLKLSMRDTSPSAMIGLAFSRSLDLPITFSNNNQNVYHTLSFSAELEAGSWLTEESRAISAGLVVSIELTEKNGGEPVWLHYFVPAREYRAPFPFLKELLNVKILEPLPYRSWRHYPPQNIESDLFRYTGLTAKKIDLIQIALITLKADLEPSPEIRFYASIDALKIEQHHGAYLNFPPIPQNVLRSSPPPYSFEIVSSHRGALRALKIIQKGSALYRSDIQKIEITSPDGLSEELIFDHLTSAYLLECDLPFSEKRATPDISNDSSSPCFTVEVTLAPTCKPGRTIQLALQTGSLTVSYEPGSEHISPLLENEIFPEAPLFVIPERENSIERTEPYLYNTLVDEEIVFLALEPNTLLRIFDLDGGTHALLRCTSDSARWRIPKGFEAGLYCVEITLPSQEKRLLKFIKKRAQDGENL